MCVKDATTKTKQPTLPIQILNRNRVEMKEITVNRQSAQKPTLKSNTISMAIINLLHFNSVWQVRVVSRVVTLAHITLPSYRYTSEGCVHFANRQLCINKIELTCRILSGRKFSFKFSNFQIQLKVWPKFPQLFHILCK